MYPFLGNLGCFQFLLFKKRSQWAPFTLPLCSYVQEFLQSRSSEWTDWLGQRVHVPSLALFLPSCFTKLLFQCSSIVKLNPFCQSTRCQMGNHKGFYYHFLDHWWVSLFFKYLLAISVCSSRTCLSHPLHIYTWVVFLKNFKDFFIYSRCLFQWRIVNMISQPRAVFFFFSFLIF